MNMRLGRVAAVHPGDHSVDLVMIDDGSRLAGVQVMTGSGTSNSGNFDLPTPSTPASGDKWSLTEQTDRDMMAVVGMVGPRPVVTGFLFPQVSQMLFKDPNMKVSRHASDVYTALDGSGNFEMAFPNGAFLRIATDPAHQDLSGKNVDGSWKASKNTGAELYFHLEQAGGKATVDISPTGAIKITTMETVEVEAVTSITLKTPLVMVDAAESTFTGHVTIQGGLNLSGGAGASAMVNGSIEVVGGDVKADAISLKDHKTSGVQPGGGTSDVPVP